MNEVDDGAARSARLAALLHSTLARRTSHVAPLQESDVRALIGALQRWRKYPARVDITDPRGGDMIYLLLEGMAGRHKLLPDGRRQILSYVLPGEFCNLSQLILPRLDYAVSATVLSSAVAFKRPVFEQLLAHWPAIARAVEVSNALDYSISREWIVTLGQRTGLERTGHLLCELYLRLREVGLAANGRFELPMTQAELGDCLGLSPVHVNRTLQELRGSELIRSVGKVVEIPDFDALARASLFDPVYLHLSPA